MISLAYPFNESSQRKQVSQGAFAMLHIPET